MHNGPPSNLRVEYREDLLTPWVEDTAAQAEEIEAGSLYRFTIPTAGAGQRFYQVIIDP